MACMKAIWSSQADVGCVLLLQCATVRIGVMIARQGPPDVAQPGVVTFGSAGVIAVRHPHHRGKLGGRQ